jgi:hypothetical protein
MLIPPIGLGRPSVTGPNEFTPQQELKTLLEDVDLIHDHMLMPRNRNNAVLQDSLHKEFAETLDRFDHFAAQLPASQRERFNEHLEDLKTHMHKFYSDLTRGESHEHLYTESSAIQTTLTLLHKDIGFPAPKRTIQL